MQDVVDNSEKKPETAREVAENVLAWAKKHNLFDKVPLDEAVDDVGGDFSSGGDAFRAQAVEEILRKKSINLVGFSEPEKKVIIFTNGKLSKSDEKILPFHTSGFSFDYIQGGVAYVKGNPPPPQTPKPFTLRGGRYTCGSSIYPAHCVGAGTFGLIVRDQNGVLYGMTNNHVAGACNNAMPGLPILAPGPLDATEDACDPFTIGRHHRLLPINDGIPENIQIDVNWDVSIFRLAEADKVTSFQGSAFDTPAHVASPMPSMRVKKVGRTTGLTGGTIVAQSASPVPVQYQVPEYGVRKNVFFETVYVVVGDNGLPFSKAGDSGSLVVADDGQGNTHAVGLVFAGNEQRGLSFILPLPEIMQKLSVEIVSGHHV
ncbi:hypothetical protein [Rhizobium rhizogenes]|uniref:hypothetical protein n=1 Tax=Rhizobium rhizogenes TaxID=359 RepID=UPI0015723D26|nr:hypothetical protein [Rhizobium rhizogenes]NTF42594.1 hypothetical protein [Rhizobium rhizogenes]